MNETKEGIIAVVSKYNSIKLEGDDNWYSPEGKCKEYVKKDLVGSKVEITMKDDKKFTFLKVLEKSESKGEQNERPSYQGTEQTGLNKRCALICAKDLVVAGKIKTEELIDYTDKMFRFMEG